MTKQNGRTSSPEKHTTHHGFEAFEQWRERIDDLPTSSLERPRIDVQLAAAFAHGVARRDLQPRRQTRFAQLAKSGLFDISSLEDLGSLAVAVWYCRRRFETYSVVDDGFRIPVDDLVEAREIRARMIRVLEYHFRAESDRRVAAEIDALLPGTGYQDLANDLQTLSDMYRRPDIREKIEQDFTHFREEDMDDAAVKARIIFEALGISPEVDAEAWRRRSDAAFTLMSDTYGRVARAGRFLFADEGTVDDDYPSLIAAVRRPRRPPVSALEPEEETGDIGDSDGDAGPDELGADAAGSGDLSPVAPNGGDGEGSMPTPSVAEAMAEPPETFETR